MRPDTLHEFTWSAGHRRACLLRWVIRQSRMARRAFYCAWARHHGQPDAVRLAREVNDLIKKQRRECRRVRGFFS